MYTCNENNIGLRCKDKCICNHENIDDSTTKDESLIVNENEIEKAKDLVIEALNMAFDSWKHKHSKSGSVINLQAMAMVEKTHDLVVRYITSMLGGKKDLPVVGF